MGACIEKEIDNNGWIGCVQENGRFDGCVGQIWIEKILKPYLRDAESRFCWLITFLCI
jgi:hypothetical protein